MDINNININTQTVGFKAKPQTERVFLKPQSDVFNREKLSLKDALKQAASIKTPYGNFRLKKEDLETFKKYYKENKIDVNTVKIFADTDIDLKSMSNIYIMQKDCGECFVQKEVPIIKKRISDFENEGFQVEFKQNIYEPENEYSLTTKSFIDNKEIEYTFERGKDLISKKVVYGKGSYKIEKLYDARNNFTSTRYMYIDNKNYRKLEKEIIERRDKNNNIIKREELSESPIKGVYNLKYTYPDGKVENIVKASIDAKTGIKTVKKDMKSSNGTRTEFLYEDDPNGNRIIDYKITDKNGKVLMNDSQTFEVISENKFISSKNHRKYEIEFSNKDLKVKDLHNDKEVKLDFKTKLSCEKQEVINLLKKVPGDELFETVDTVSNIIGLKKEEALDAGFSASTKWLVAGDNLFAFLHELGHAKDNEYRTGKDVEKKKDNYFYRTNENIKNTYLKEKILFDENYPDSQRNNMRYFLDAKTHYAGKSGGLSEVIAETNAITSALTNADLGDLGVRAQYLQQHFPETIAAIKKEMEYKHDVEAIEYYGT